MAHPAVNTKVELVVESFEALINAVVAHHAPSNELRGATFTGIADARKDCADALREFLAPAVRVVANNGERVG